MLFLLIKPIILNNINSYLEKRGLKLVDLDYYKNLKDKFSEEKRPEITKLGYNMACGLSKLEQKIHIAVRLQPLPGSPDPIDHDLLARIKNEILTDNYQGVPLDIQYVGIIRADSVKR